MLYPIGKEKVKSVTADRVVFDNGSVCAYTGGQALSLWSDEGVYEINVIDGKLVVTSPDE